MSDNKNKYQPQEDYAKRQGWKVFGYKIDKELGEKFRAECIARGTSQAREIEKLIKFFLKKGIDKWVNL